MLWSPGTGSRIGLTRPRYLCPYLFTTHPSFPSPCLSGVLTVMNSLSTLTPKESSTWLLLCGRFYSRCFGCKIEDVWFLFGSRLSQEIKEHSLVLNTELLAKDSVNSENWDAHSANQLWIIWETVQNFPEKSSLRSAYQVSPWLAPLSTKINELVMLSLFDCWEKSKNTPREAKPECCTESQLAESPLDWIPLHLGDTGLAPFKDSYVQDRGQSVESPCPGFRFLWAKMKIFNI